MSHLKHEIMVPTSLSPTAAPGFHLSQTLDWQSEFVRRRGQVTVIPIQKWVLPHAVVAERRSGEGPASDSPPSADWGRAEARLREIYPTPVSGDSAARLVAEGRGDR